MTWKERDIPRSWIFFFDSFVASSRIWGVYLTSFIFICCQLSTKTTVIIHCSTICLSYLKFLWTSETQQFNVDSCNTLSKSFFEDARNAGVENPTSGGKHSFINRKHLVACLRSIFPKHEMSNNFPPTRKLWFRKCTEKHITKLKL